MRSVAVMVMASLIGSPGTALWKCVDPVNPPRFVTTEDKKEDPPPCGAWVELRSSRMMELDFLHARYEAANVFLARAAEQLGVDYPGTEGGSPITTSQLYRTPARFGVELGSIEGAEVGDLILYDGLGGILVEVREEGSAWVRQVLYPSTKHDFGLNLADPSDLGRAIGSEPPQILSRTDEPEGS